METCSYIICGGKDMVYGCCRVSTKKQYADGNSIEDQQAQILARYPDAQIIVEAYTGGEERPIFSELLEKVQAGDIIVCAKLDRFCRSVRVGLGYIDKLLDKGVSIHILNMGLIEDTSMGRLIYTVLLAFAEFEKNQIIERCQAGKEIAKTREGFRDGRPKKYSKAQLTHAVELLEGHSYKQVESMTGISKSTLQRAKRNKKAAL